MKLSADPEMLAWLDSREWIRADFEWDDFNTAKSLEKHDVTWQETEPLFWGPYALAGRILWAGDELRWPLYGVTPSGRLLTLIFTRRGDRIRPISTRPMRAKERRDYAEEEE
jgi:uncharacterized DUF497 family protein